MLKAQTLAILEQQDSRNQDLVFTTYGIVPVRYGIPRSSVPYPEITWNSRNKKELRIGSRFTSDDINMEALFELIQKLKTKGKPLPESQEDKLLGIANRKELGAPAQDRRTGER